MTAATTQLTVSAAASLITAFGQMKDSSRRQPRSDVVLNYGGSSGLAQQIVIGAPVDVFAAANTATMDTVAKAGLVAATPRIFVTNKLETNWAFFYLGRHRFQRPDAMKGRGLRSS